MPRDRNEWLWTIELLAVAVLVFLFLGVIAISPLGAIIPLLLLVLPAFGVYEWRHRGHGWLPTLSWTVPLAGWILVEWFAAPAPLGAVLFLLGAGFLLLMLTDKGVAFWYERVLRSRSHPR